jgi:hypothetical protein
VAKDGCFSRNESERLDAGWDRDYVTGVAENCSNISSLPKKVDATRYTKILRKRCQGLELRAIPDNREMRLGITGTKGRQCVNEQIKSLQPDQCPNADH